MKSYGKIESQSKNLLNWKNCWSIFQMYWKLLNLFPVLSKIKFLWLNLFLLNLRVHFWIDLLFFLSFWNSWHVKVFLTTHSSIIELFKVCFLIYTFSLSIQFQHTRLSLVRPTQKISIFFLFFFLVIAETFKSLVNQRLTRFARAAN